MQTLGLLVGESKVDEFLPSFDTAAYGFMSSTAGMKPLFRYSINDEFEIHEEPLSEHDVQEAQWQLKHALHAYLETNDPAPNHEWQAWWQLQ